MIIGPSDSNEQYSITADNLAQFEFARRTVEQLANPSVSAPDALHSCDSLLFVRNSEGHAAELFAQALFDRPALVTSDSLLPRRLAAGVATTSMRPDPTCVLEALDTARAIGFVRRVAARLAFLIYLANREEDDSGLPKNIEKDQRNPDQLFQALSANLSLFVDGLLSAFDLAKRDQISPCEEGVMIESIVEALETPWSVDSLSANERDELGLYILKRAVRVYRISRASLNRLRARVEAGLEAGFTNEPYGCDPEQRKLVSDPWEPLRFSEESIKRDTFYDTARRLPRLLELIPLGVN